MNPYSIQIPFLIRASIDRGVAGVVGKGIALWPDVHIDDCADLYIVVWDAAVRDPEHTGHGTDGYYFGANGEHPWYDISKGIGRAMVELGLSKTDEPTTFSDEELIKYYGDVVSVQSYPSWVACTHDPSILARDLLRHKLPRPCYSFPRCGLEAQVHVGGHDCQHQA